MKKLDKKDTKIVIDIATNTRKNSLHPDPEHPDPDRVIVSNNENIGVIKNNTLNSITKSLPYPTEGLIW